MKHFMHDNDKSVVLTFETNFAQEIYIKISKYEIDFTNHQVMAELQSQ